VYPCPVPAVFVPVPGYRRVNGYTGMGLRRTGHIFFGKNPLYPYPFTRVPAPVYRRPYQYPYPAYPPNLNLNLHFSVYLSIVIAVLNNLESSDQWDCYHLHPMVKTDAYQFSTFSLMSDLEQKNSKKKKKKKKSVPVPVYPRRTRV
jgi:hypothetical protein